MLCWEKETLLLLTRQYELYIYMCVWQGKILVPGYIFRDIRNWYGSTLPNMNGIEIPDPYCEFELIQRLGIATDMCYTILESPEHASN